MKNNAVYVTMTDWFRYSLIPKGQFSFSFDVTKMCYTESQAKCNVQRLDDSRDWPHFIKRIHHGIEKDTKRQHEAVVKRQMKMKTDLLESANI